MRVYAALPACLMDSSDAVTGLCDHPSLPLSTLFGYPLSASCCRRLSSIAVFTNVSITSGGIVAHPHFAAEDSFFVLQPTRPPGCCCLLQGCQNGFLASAFGIAV